MNTPHLIKKVIVDYASPFLDWDAVEKIIKDHEIESNDGPSQLGSEDDPWRWYLDIDTAEYLLGIEDPDSLIDKEILKKHIKFAKRTGKQTLEYYWY